MSEVGDEGLLIAISHFYQESTYFRRYISADICFHLIIQTIVQSSLSVEKNGGGRVWLYFTSKVKVNKEEKLKMDVGLTSCNVYLIHFIHSFLKIIQQNKMLPRAGKWIVKEKQTKSPSHFNNMTEQSYVVYLILSSYTHMFYIRLHVLCYNEIVSVSLLGILRLFETCK